MYFAKAKNCLVLFYAIIVFPDDNQKERMEIVAETWIKNKTYLLKCTRLDHDSLIDAAQKFKWKWAGGLES